MNLKKSSSYQAALRAIESSLSSDDSVLVCIDGRCGSGKTTIADMLQRHFNCGVIHMDDFYLPMTEREDHWMEKPGGNMDFVRLRTEVIEPIFRRETYSYRPYCCRSGAYGPAVCKSPTPVVILEGSYSFHPALQIEKAVRIFVTCSQEVRLQRLREREGERIGQFLQRWIPMEERYFAAYQIPDENAYMICTDAASGKE